MVKTRITTGDAIFLAIVIALLIYFLFAWLFWLCIFGVLVCLIWFIAIVKGGHHLDHWWHPLVGLILAALLAILLK